MEIGIGRLSFHTHNFMSTLPVYNSSVYFPGSDGEDGKEQRGGHPGRIGMAVSRPKPFFKTHFFRTFLSFF